MHTRRYTLTICFAVLSAALVPAYADDAQAIDKLYAEWRNAVEAADIERYVSVLHDDVRLLPPGADPIVSAAAYGAFLVPVFESATYKIIVDQAPQIDIVGNVAVAEYVYTIDLKLKNPDQGVSEPGALTASRTQSRYFDVLLKNDAGQWRVWRHSWQAFE